MTYIRSYFTSVIVSLFCGNGCMFGQASNLFSDLIVMLFCFFIYLHFINDTLFSHLYMR